MAKKWRQAIFKFCELLRWSTTRCKPTSASPTSRPIIHSPSGLLCLANIGVLPRIDTFQLHWKMEHAPSTMDPLPPSDIMSQEEQYCQARKFLYRALLWGGIFQGPDEVQRFARIIFFSGLHHFREACIQDIGNINVYILCLRSNRHEIETCMARFKIHEGWIFNNEV